METSSDRCQPEHIAAYLDGELDASARAFLERHVQQCAACNAELNAQRLFVCELDSTLALNPDLHLPRNFAEIVAARAESDMRGVRDGSEHRRALRFCLILAITSFALIGAAAGKALLFSGWAIADNTFELFALLWTTMHDAAVGLTVISRVIGGVLIPESPFAGLVALLFALAVVLLSLLVSSYHRHQEMPLSE
ncbi:MAG: anti-sigma factor family protein [Pyrinomonadaceae bacterium]